LRADDLIAKKRDGFSLSREELDWLVRGYMQGNIPDYQVSAWLMAVYLQGMTREETKNYTMALINSGERLDLSFLYPRVVDKHSSGGVGDKTTIAVAPLVAAAGVPVAKMSGRGLGFTGGTVDKLESIPGYRVSMTTEEFLRQVEDIGIAVISQTERLAPADKLIYALRDVTATVESTPLIAASIMSKKIAAGAGAVLLDVKVGSGAFLQEEEDAKSLAELMVEIGCDAGVPTAALLSSMDQPLGNAIGNSLEVAEAFRALQGYAPPDFKQICLELGSRMLVMAGRTGDINEGKQLLQRVWDSGRALAKAQQWVKSQGGDPAVVEDPDLLPRERVCLTLSASRTGYVSSFCTREIGRAAVLLGAGRARKEDAVSPGAGIVLTKKLADPVEAGEPIAVVYAPSQTQAEEGVSKLKKAVIISNSAPAVPPLIKGIIGK